MHVEDIRDFCLSLPEATEDMPFGDDTLVMRVGGKIFALISLGKLSVNVKCDPDKAVELREQYPEVLPGFHMNKKHWNTLIPNGSAEDHLIRQWLKDSYDLIVKKLPKEIKNTLAL